jgi:hypothetical protein
MTFDTIGSRKQLNPQGLRRILVRLQGAPKGAYGIDVAFGATPKTGRKTSPLWRIDLFSPGLTNVRIQIPGSSVQASVQKFFIYDT